MKRAFAVAGLAICWAGGLVMPAVAKDLLPRAAMAATAELPYAVELSPDPSQAVDTAHSRLSSSVQQLEEFLTAGGEQKRLAWQEWLGISDLRDQLTRPKPDLQALKVQLGRYSQDQPGLEWPAFAAVRRELRHYLAAHEYAAADSPSDVFHARLDELSSVLRRLDARPTADDARRAGRLVGWLESLGPETVDLVAAVRGRYCHTNAVAQASARLVNLLMARSVAERRFVSEEIMGAYTQGMAVTHGHVSLGFVPSREHATLELRLLGRTNCPANVAQRGRVSVYSSSNTTINAGKQVHLDEEGLELVPAIASTATNLQINDIDAGRRFVERVAWRRVGRMTPQAEDLASTRARVEASSKLDQEAAAALAGANDMFRQKIRAPLIRRDALPAQWQFSTDREHLRVALTQYNAGQLAVASPAPEFSTSYDIAMGAHESMIANLTECMIGGATIEDKTWLEIVKLLTSEEPLALWVHDRSERWSVTLAEELPLIASFDAGYVTFTLRLTKVTRGASVLEQPVEVEARFATRSTRDGPVLVRDGDVQVRFSDIKGSEHQAITRAFLQRKFGAVFPPELIFYGLVPPAGGSLAKLNSLSLADFKSAAGWLTFAYQLKTE